MPFSRLSIAIVCASAGLLMSAARVHTQNPTLQGHPDDYPRADIEYGIGLYQQHCFGCHGATGDGVAGVDLRSGKFRNATTDPQLRTVITNGFPTLGMPAFKLDPVELTGIVAYLRNMNAVDAGSSTHGESGRGLTVFEGKGACLSCHRVNNKGSRKAPDLSDIGAMRSARVARAVAARSEQPDDADQSAGKNRHEGRTDDRRTSAE
jgi:mono/diheme cytochrome c family protein